MSADQFMYDEIFQKASKAILAHVYGDVETFEKRMLDTYFKSAIARGEKEASLKEEYPRYFRKPECIVEENTNTVGSALGGTTFTLRGGPETCLKFTMARYPYCCGALVLHNFHCNADIPHRLLDAFFNAILYAGQPLWGLYMKNRRIIVMMVQHGPGVTDTEGVHTPGDNPRMYFQNLWDYFHTKKVNTRYMYNINSGNLLHDMEVIL